MNRGIHVEITYTQDRHPDDPPGGMHTNGPPCMWLRIDGGEWVEVYYLGQHRRRKRDIDAAIQLLREAVAGLGELEPAE
jgi:hypothetical protein